jgi:hypothetical protein
MQLEAGTEPIERQMKSVLVNATTVYARLLAEPKCSSHLFAKWMNVQG